MINHIFTLQSSIYPPPATTNLMELPLKSMSWPNFERLCLKMVENIDSFHIYDCEIIGRQGQKQEGIDIYSRKSSGEYYAYQCKRYQTISVSKLKSILKEFEQGEWLSKTKKFHICTTASFSDIKLQNEFEVLKDTFLTKYEIEIIKWDFNNINRLLKDYPMIVYDFFGENWCKQFCGNELYNNIINTARLDGNLIAEYKNKLGKFYSDVFNTYDKGLPSLEDSNLKIEDRFVMLDTIKESNNSFASFQNQNKEENNQTYLDLPFDAYEDNYRNILKRKSTDHEIKIKKTFERKSLDDEINVDSLIIGEAGIGKSTFLRYLILSILKDFPNSSLEINKKFGNLIPVYIPFAYLTSKLNENRDFSVLQILELWFSSFDSNDLYNLVKNAFKDERLLLVIDGIDEYTNLDLARIALNKLNIYKVNKNAKIILSSRQYGYKILKEDLPEVNILKLAPLSTEQQRKIVSKWIINKYPENDSLSNKYIEDFFKELELIPDLQSLSEIPLLLNILLVQKLKQQTLPRDKYTAYSEIVEHLINKHYQKRVSNANAKIENPFYALIEYWKDIFSKVAFEFQVNTSDGILKKDDVKKIVSSFLENELGFDFEKRTSIANKFTEFGVNNLGVLIEKSHIELAFIHRQFQEFLSAKELRKKDRGEIVEYIKRFSNNPQWEQTILLFFFDIENNKDFIDYLKIVREENILLSYKISLSTKSCPILTAKENFEEIVEKYESELRIKVKNELLDIILLGIYNTKLEEEYKKLSESYIPYVYEFSDIRIGALENIEDFHLNSDITSFLFLSLLNGRNRDKLQVSRVLNKVSAVDDIRDYLIKLSKESYDLDVRAFAINSLLNKDVENKTILDLIETNANSSNNLLLFFTIKAKIFIGSHKISDFEKLIQISKDLHSFDFENEIFWVFTEGWGNDKRLEKISLESTNKIYSDNKIDSTLAWKILFHNFNKSKDTIDKIVNHIESETYIFSGYDNYKLFGYLSYYFKDNITISDAVYNWLTHRDFYSREEAEISIISRDNRFKNFLIENLTNKEYTNYWQVFPLVKNWLQDKEVFKLLKSLYNKDNFDFSLALFIPDLFERNEGIKLCEKILFSDDYFFYRAIEPIIKLDKDYFEKALLKKFINNKLKTRKKEADFGSFWEIFSQLLIEFPNNSDIKNLIKEEENNYLYFFESLIISGNYNDELLKKLLSINKYLKPESRKFVIKKVISSNCFHPSFEVIKKESNPDCKTILAYNYFKNQNYDEIKTELEYFSTYKGFGYETNINIGFLGHVLHKKIDDFWKIRNQDNLNIKLPLNKDFESSFNEEFFKYFDIHFEYINSSKKGGVEEIFKNTRDTRIEEFYSLLVKYHSDQFNSKNHIFNFVVNNYEQIRSPELFIFLFKEFTNDKFTIFILKELIIGKKHINNNYLLGIKIGEFYNDNLTIKELLINNIEYNQDICLAALLIGWKNEEILYDYFNDFKNKKTLIQNQYLAYLIQFQYYEDGEIKLFFENIEKSKIEIPYHQPFLINPLLYKVKNRRELQDHLFKLLCKSKSDYVTVLYCSILNEINYNEQDFNEWKKRQCENLNINKIIGYNIIENKHQSLKELIQN